MNPIFLAKKSWNALYETVWTPPEIQNQSSILRIFARIWRIVEITISGTISNNITIHAAALTYYALMALAPFVMLVLTIFGIVMNVKGEQAVEVVQTRIAETFQILAPENAEKNPAGTTENPEEKTVPADVSENQEVVPEADETESDALKMVAPQLQEFSGMLLKNTMTNSGSTGTIGTLILAVLAIFMISHVEDAYNRIWAVKKPRSWPRRFLIYFVFVVLGGVLIAMTTSLLSISAIFKSISSSANDFSEIVGSVPGGSGFFALMTSVVPALLAFVIFTLLAGSTNRYLPNVPVRWLPALIGGAFVALAFIFCVKLASLFVGKITEFNSIYGNLGVIFILMFALYLSWLFLLIGGQISFAIQNEKFFKNNSVSWLSLSSKSRQEIYFACLFTIFEVCFSGKKGISLDELSDELRIPANMLSECVDALSSLGFVVERVPEKSDSGTTKRYGVEVPVGKMSISEIRLKFDNFCPSEPGVSLMNFHFRDEAASAVSLGGSEKSRSALSEFSRTFSLGKNEKTLEEILAASRERR